MCKKRAKQNQNLSIIHLFLCKGQKVAARKRNTAFFHGQEAFFCRKNPGFFAQILSRTVFFINKYRKTYGKVLRRFPEKNIPGIFFSSQFRVQAVSHRLNAEL